MPQIEGRQQAALFTFLQSRNPILQRQSCLEYIAAKVGAFLATADYVVGTHDILQSEFQYAREDFVVTI